ncbi:MAG: hypothetical protein QNK43_11440, partial [Amphritea sp.]|nr:hypothetical protein [Amphritea sp.]
RGGLLKVWALSPAEGCVGGVYTSSVGCLVRFANRTINISASCIIVIGINGAIHSSSVPAVRFILHQHPTGNPRMDMQRLVTVISSVAH